VFVRFRDQDKWSHPTLLTLPLAEGKIPSCGIRRKKKNPSLDGSALRAKPAVQVGWSVGSRSE
jgi:hypothetical protein